MQQEKIVYVAFAPEDVRQRDALRRDLPQTPYRVSFVDYPIKAPRDQHWQDRVRISIRRADGFLALVSSNSLTCVGQKWEITCAKEEKKSMLGVRAYVLDQTEIAGIRIIRWDWLGIVGFLDTL